MKNELCEYTGITRKPTLSCQRRGNLALTVVRQRFIISLWLDNKEKETHDCGAGKAIHLRPGMDATGTSQKKRKALSLCSSKGKEQPKGRVEVHSTSLESGGPNRTRCARQAGTDHKLKATRRWQLESTVADDPIPKVSQAAGKRSSIATGAWPKSIIDSIAKYCQWLPLQREIGQDALVASKERVS